MHSDGEYAILPALKRHSTGVLNGYSTGTLRVLRGARPGSRASGAGVTWTSRTTSAPWAARYGHTSVVDAAGAIYVIGGDNDAYTTYFNDVYASTDGGARPDSVGGWSVGYSRG